MQMPWKQKQKIQELEEKIESLQQEIEDLKEEKESYRARFEAEKERRSKLASEKQEAEKKLKKLKQKEPAKSRDTKEEEKEGTTEGSAEDVSLERVQRIIEKIDSYSPPKDDLLTVYAPNSVEDLSDLKGLKNSISREEYEFLSGEAFIAFLEPDIISFKLKARTFFSTKWNIDDSFGVEPLSDFISRKKQWAVVSAGDSKIIEEQDGDILEVEEVSSRVERKQKKGGFSQGRFERKRDEQIQQHLDQLEEKISEETLLVGEERLCKKLPGKHLGGFDDSRNAVDALYGFRLEKI